MTFIALQIRHDKGPSIREGIEKSPGWVLLPDLHPEALLAYDIETFKQSYKHVHMIMGFPPCKAFSMAAVSHYWDGFIPKNEKAVHYLEIAYGMADRFMAMNKEIVWYMENPRGVLRKMIEKDRPNFPKRVAITQCTYDEEHTPSLRQKPTMIWTNLKNPQFRPPCGRGAKCHVNAPAGSATGSQGQWGLAKSALPLPLQLEFINFAEQEWLKWMAKATFH